MAKITFSSLLLYVNDNLADLDFCKKIEENPEKNGIKMFQKNPFEFYSTFDKENKLLWIEVKTGKVFPYADTLYDIKTQEAVANPRKDTQAELRTQFFAFYDILNKNLYISNKSFVSTLLSYLRTVSKEENIVVKETIKSIEEFCEEISKIKTIKLISKNSLFAQNDDLFSKVINQYGLGNPEQFQISVNYNYALVTERFKNKIKDLFNKKQSTEIDSCICVGKDNNGLERYFNMETFGCKTEIDVSQNENKMFDGIEIKSKLLNILRNKNA